MRRAALAVVTGLIVSSVGAAHAANCVDTSQNNSAFSSAYVTGESPCKPGPKTAARLPKPADVRAARENAKPSPVAIDDGKPHIVPTEHGTLIKSGDTTVCVAGSVSMDISSGSGRWGGAGRSGPAPSCY